MPIEYDYDLGIYRDVYYDSKGTKFFNRADRDRSTRRLREEIERRQAAAKRLNARPTATKKKVVTKARLSRPMASVVATLPRKLQPIAKEIALDPAMNGPMLMLMERASEFSSPAAALLAGIALDPVARKHFDDHLDTGWKQTELPKLADEVIIGGGLHAAIYSAVRVAMGKPAPLVLERRERVGGAFAVSASPSFYLNSRNRPGPLSIPGEMGSLNVLPASMLQPSDLGGAEYQTNDALAMVIRTTLAMSTEVLANAPIKEIRVGTTLVTRPYEIVFEDDSVLRAKRVIKATGLNEPRSVTGLTSDRIVNFEQFMRMLDEPFALRGMERIAVLGGGDGGKTVIESLTGQGPARPFSIATLDFPQKINWYGAPAFSCEEFQRTQRPRYRAISRLLPSVDQPDRPFRVSPKKSAGVYSVGYNQVYVDEVPFDLIIDCSGYLLGSTVAVSSSADDVLTTTRFWMVGKRRVAVAAGLETTDGDFQEFDIFTIGPAANIPINDQESLLLRGIAENATSLFRYASRTAALASSLS